MVPPPSTGGDCTGWYCHQVGLFKKKTSGSTDGQRQYPDELADRAEQLYGSQQFGAAADQFALAVDKLHTMLVATPESNRIRQPGPRDQAILDGLRNSVGASKATGQSFDTAAIESALAYLGQIERTAGAEAGRYASAIRDISYELEN